MSKKNQQMKIAVVAVLVILLISSIIATVRSSTSKTKDVSVTPQDAAAKKELVKAVEDKRGKPSLPVEKPVNEWDKKKYDVVAVNEGDKKKYDVVAVNEGDKKKYDVVAVNKGDKKSDIPFFTNPNGSVKGINQLTDEEYETLRKFYNRFDSDGYKHTDYPNRHKRRHIHEKINFLKEKPLMYSFLPGHEYSHNMNLSKGDNTFAERQQQLTQKGLTDEQILNWMDGWYRYSKKHKKIKLGGGQIVDEDDYQDIFPFHTLSIIEIVNLMKDMKEQIEKDQKTRMNLYMYNFDDRNNQRVEGYRI